MLQIDGSFNGSQVDVHVGETLAISLTENASTGFRWIIPHESASRSGKILHENEPAAQQAGDTPPAHVPPGAPRVRRFYFEALEPGTVELEFDYRRPWEVATSPARTFKLRIRVQPVPER